MTHTESAATQDHIDETEAARMLRSLAHNRTGSVPEDVLVRHVMRVTEGGDWPLQRAAMEACLRRFDFADRDELRVAERPGDNRVFGIYRTRRRRAPMRPYATLLERLEPLAASCDCPDYLRSSLGLCKHLMVVLNDLASRPRRWQQALAQPCRNEPARRARLLWDPVRPLTGAGDWLQRVRLEPGRADRRAAVATAQRFFRAGDNGALLLKDAFADRPQRRLALIEALRPLVSNGRSAQAGEPVAQPAVAALLAAEQERLEPAAGRTPQRGRRHALRTLRRKLYPYQMEGVERAIERGRLLLADDMGLGKTAQAIAVCHALWKSGSIQRGLIIAPASLKAQWLREWQLFTDLPAEIVDGGPEARRRTYESLQSGFLIINYEQVLRDLDAMRDWKPGIVVLDEAQRIKNWATKTAVYIKTLRPPFRLVLTGTPMENRLEELASILDWVDDLALEPKWRLVPWHTIYSDGRRESVGARNLDTLRERLAPCTLRRVRRGDAAETGQRRERCRSLLQAHDPHHARRRRVH